MARTNGGIIGKTNKTSFGKCTVTTQTSTGCVTLQPGTRVVNAVLVAGGGSGGNDAGSGGGAGGLRQFSSLNASGAIPVTIGAGGTNPGSPQSNGTVGTNSSFTTGGTTYCATGGGAGVFTPPAPSAVKDGGSGGGYRGTIVGGLGNAGGYTPPEGQPGAGVPTVPACSGAGGGGGFSCAGSPGLPTAGGNGGDGICLSGCFPGSPITAFAGGGGGGGNSAPAPGGTGGLGGGGAGGARTPGGGQAGGSGCANTGGGGGGSGGGPANANAGSGGSGVVVVKELNKASGVWNLKSQLASQQQGTWPRFILQYSMDYLVVAGGGGGSTNAGGGGGAGGYRASGYGPSPLQASALTIEAGCYSVTVGAGGPGAYAGTTPGTDSIFNPCGAEGSTMITATAGGRGGEDTDYGGDPGGSGGGGGARPPAGVPGGTGNTPSFSPPQGQPGGNGAGCVPAGNRSQGGGGGAGGAGGNASSGSGGSGGAGVPNLINCGATPFSITGFAGGGGGGSCATAGSANPVGGGGNGGGAGGNGTANTGGGGGGAQDGTPTVGGTGGSGVVVLRFPACATVSVSPCTNLTGTHPGGEKVAVFTVTGTLTVS